MRANGADVEAGERSLQGLLDAVSAQEIVLTEDQWRQLRDWDTPSDVG